MFFDTSIKSQIACFMENKSKADIKVRKVSVQLKTKC